MLLLLCMCARDDYEMVDIYANVYSLIGPLYHIDQQCQIK